MKKNTYIKAKLAKRYQSGGSIYTQDKDKPTEGDMWKDAGMAALDIAGATTGFGAIAYGLTGKDISDMVGYEYKTDVGKTSNKITNTTADLYSTVLPTAAGIAAQSYGVPAPVASMGTELAQKGIQQAIWGEQDTKTKGAQAIDPFLKTATSAAMAGSGGQGAQGQQVTNFTMKKGGIVPKTTINVERNELEVSNGKIIKDFKNKPKHPEDPSMIDPGGNIKAQEGNIIIPANLREKYLKGDKLTRQSIEANVTNQQAKREQAEQQAIDLLSQGAATQEFDMFGNGGKIKINKKYKSTFDDLASSSNMSTEDYINTLTMKVKYAKGGPIKVTDPNDPQLKSYQDSLNLYNYTLEQYGRNPVGPLGQKIDPLSAHPGIYDREAIKPLGVTNIPSATGTAQFPIYKKPVQEVIYDKPFAKAATVAKIQNNPTTEPIVPNKAIEGPVYRQVDVVNKPAMLSGSPQYRTNPTTGKTVPVYKDQFGRETFDSTYKKSVRIPDEELKGTLKTDVNPKKYQYGGGVDGPETFDYNAFLNPMTSMPRRGFEINNSQQGPLDTVMNTNVSYPSQRTYGDPMQEYLADKAAAEARGAADLKATTPSTGSPNYMDYANKIIPHLGNMYQFGQTFGKKDYVPLTTNPEYGNVKSLMRNRQIDMRPIIEDINVQSRIARQNARLAGNVGGYLSNSAQIGANTQRALANARMQEQMANNQMRAEEAQSLMGLGSEAARYQNMYDTGRVMTDANARNIRAAALQNTSGIYQGQSRDVKMDQMDQVKFQTLKDMFPYFTYDDYYRLKSRNQG